MVDAVAEWPLPIHRLTVQQYHRMIETRVLTEDDRVELLEGWIVTKMAHKPIHDGTISRIQKRLEAEISIDWLIRIQSVITTRDSEPEPDLAVVSAPLEKYLERHPTPFDVGLLIEVSDTTLECLCEKGSDPLGISGGLTPFHTGTETDRAFKGRLYARARLPVYWIANLVDKVIEVYTDPIAGKRPHYRHQQDYGLSESVPLIIQGTKEVLIPVRDLLTP